MKLKKIAQIIFISCSIAALGACSTPGTKSSMDSASGSSAEAGAEASGLGDGQDFGDNGGTRHASSKNTYYFSFDKSEIRPQDKPAILANANYLLAHPKAHILLEGHTDPRGSREYNVGLGERRANAVLAMLKAHGVNPSQIRVVSYGAERLAVAGRSETDYQLDRRAMIVYLKS